jgi:hypothetical protein
VYPVRPRTEPPQSSSLTTTTCVGGSTDPGERTAESGCAAIGADVRRSVYEMNESLLVDLTACGEGPGTDDFLTGDAGAAGNPVVVVKVVVGGMVMLCGGEPDTSPSGETLLAGDGARELAMGLANPDVNPLTDAAPLTLALALMRPLTPIPCRRRDMTGGEPLEVPDPAEGSDLGEPANWGADERTVTLDGSSLSAVMAESSTEGTESSIASVAFARGMRCGFTAWVGEGTAREWVGMGSMSRSKIAELDEWLGVE